MWNSDEVKGARQVETSERRFQLAWKVGDKFRASAFHFLIELSVRRDHLRAKAISAPPLSIQHRQYCSHAARLISSRHLFMLYELPKCMTAENGVNRLKTACIQGIKEKLGDVINNTRRRKDAPEIACSQTLIITLKNSL